MKRRQEEELIQMAFGEMPESTLGCPDAQAKLRSYCELRQGLQSLKDIPEMQMSTERLRDAILSGGLKPSPEPKVSLSWIAASMAVCAVGFMAVSRMGPQGASGPVVFKEGPATISAPVVMNWEPTSPKIDAQNWLGFTDAIANEGTEVQLARKSNPIRIARKAIDGKKSAPVAPPAAVIASKSAEPAPGDVKAKSAADMNTTPITSAENNDIIVIDAQAQNDEGISRAREVRPTTNVVVGG